MTDQPLDPTQPIPAPVQEPAPAPAPIPAPAPEPAPAVAAPEPAPAPLPLVTPDPQPGPSPSTSPAEPEPAAGDPQPATPAAPPPTATPVTVNNYTKRSDDDALEGGWVDIVDGPYAGRYGAYVQDVAHNPQDGFPEVILVRTRDALNELVQVGYSQVRPSERTGGR